MQKFAAVLFGLVLVFTAGCDQASSTANGVVTEAPTPGGKYVVIDVRTPGEFAGGHVAGATNVPVDVIGERIAEVVPDKSTPVYVYCRSGHRAATAMKTLESRGYTVQNLGSLANAQAALKK